MVSRVCIAAMSSKSSESKTEHPIWDEFVLKAAAELRRAPEWAQDFLLRLRTLEGTPGFSPTVQSYRALLLKFMWRHPGEVPGMLFAEDTPLSITH